MKVLYNLILAFTGTLGFAMYYQLNKDKWIFASLLGVVSWSIYTMLFSFSENCFIAAFVATFFVGILSEVFARIKKTPSTMFFVPSIIPLIPGSKLYYLIESFIEQDMANTLNYSTDLALILIGMGTGYGAVKCAMTIRERLIINHT